MNRETIKSVAEKFCTTQDGKNLIRVGVSGYLKSVWHSPCDIAEPGKDCLVEYMDGDGNVCIRIDWRSEYEWVNAFHYDKILRWAYIDDLIPDRN